MSSRQRNWEVIRTIRHAENTPSTPNYWLKLHTESIYCYCCIMMLLFCSVCKENLWKCKSEESQRADGGKAPCSLLPHISGMDCHHQRKKSFTSTRGPSSIVISPVIMAAWSNKPEFILREGFKSLKSGCGSNLQGRGQQLAKMVTVRCCLLSHQ